MNKQRVRGLEFPHSGWREPERQFYLSTSDPCFRRFQQSSGHWSYLSSLGAKGEHWTPHPRERVRKTQPLPHMILYHELTKAESSWVESFRDHEITKASLSSLCLYSPWWNIVFFCPIPQRNFCQECHPLYSLLDSGHLRRCCQFFSYIK